MVIAFVMAGCVLTQRTKDETERDVVFNTFEEEAPELDPNNPRTYVDRSDFYRLNPKTYNQAVANATKAIELDPSLAEAYVSRASVLVEISHFAHAPQGSLSEGEVSTESISAWALPTKVLVEKAIADATKAIELNPDLANAYFARAHVYLDTKKSELAITDYDRVLELSPNIYLVVMAFVHRSRGHWQLGLLNQAIQDAIMALELEPDLAAALKIEPSMATWHGMGLDAIVATAYINRGLAYDEQGSVDVAAADYTAAIQRDPEFAEAYGNRAKTYVSMGLYQQALADANRAIEINRHLAPAFNARALAYLGLGRTEDALTDVTRAIDQDPVFAMAYSNRAYMNTGLRRYDHAVVDATKALELDPNLVPAYANRAEAHLLTGDYDRAISDSTSALERDPTLVGTLIGRAFAYVAKGEYSLGLDDADRALTLRPRQLEALYVRGKALLMLTNGEQGREDLNRVIETSQKSNLVDLARRALFQAEQ